jgi:DNA (cytosine-5)-methyltransferase 1
MNRIDAESETFVAVTFPTLGKESFSPAKSSSGQMVDFCVAHSLRADGLDASEDGTGRGTPLVPVVCDVANSLNGNSGRMQVEATYVPQRMAVRRLLPSECEALQGFPRGSTNIPGSADGPRYRSLGNSMAVPVMAWIGRRIQEAYAND